MILIFTLTASTFPAPQAATVASLTATSLLCLLPGQGRERRKRRASAESAAAAKESAVLPSLLLWQRACSPTPLLDLPPSRAPHRSEKDIFMMSNQTWMKKSTHFTWERDFYINYSYEL